MVAGTWLFVRSRCSPKGWEVVTSLFYLVETNPIYLIIKWRIAEWYLESHHVQIAEYPSPVSESKLNLTNYPLTYEAQVQAYILKYLLLLNLQLAKNLSSAYKNLTEQEHKWTLDSHKSLLIIGLSVAKKVVIMSGDILAFSYCCFKFKHSTKCRWYT